MDVVVRIGPTKGQCAAGVVVFCNGVCAWLHALTESVSEGTGLDLTAIDDNVAAYAIVTLFVIVATAYGWSIGKSCMASDNDAAIDSNAAAGDVVLVASDGCRILTTIDLNVAAVDDERTHLYGADS